MKQIIQRTKLADINSVYPHEKNVNQGDIGAIHESIKTNGFIGNIIVQKSTNKILAGKHRWQAAKMLGYEKLDITYVDLDDNQAIKFMLIDNRSTRLGHDDPVALAALLSSLMQMDSGLEGTGYTGDDIDLLLFDMQQVSGSTMDDSSIDMPSDSIQSSVAIPGSLIPEKPVVSTKAKRAEADGLDTADFDTRKSKDGPEEESGRGRPATPNFFYDNEWGIPTLDLSLQAERVESRIELWDASSRKKQMPGTFHFFSDNCNYGLLWREPYIISDSGCVSLIEPGFPSILASKGTAKASALYRVWQKRVMLRNWQASGIRVFVDVNVAEEFQELNMIGVPKGWRSYATRGSMDKLETIGREYDLACEHAESSEILFMVYSGGRKIQQMCEENGWVWVPDINDISMNKAKFEKMMKPKNLKGFNPKK